MVMSSNHVRLLVISVLTQANFAQVVDKHHTIRQPGFTVTNMLTGEVRVAYYMKGDRDWDRVKKILGEYKPHIERAVGAECRVELVEDRSDDVLYISIKRK